MAGKKKAQADASPNAADGSKKADAVSKDADKKDVGGVEKESRCSMPPKPDEKAFEKRVNDVKAKIDEKKGAMQKLSEKIDKANTGKEEYEEKRTVLYNALDLVKSQRQELINRVRELNEQQRTLRKQNRENERELKQMESSVTAITEEGIDKEIAALEYKMSTTTMTLKEEKECMKKIKALKVKRPEVQKTVKEYEQMKAKIEISGDLNGEQAADSIKSMDATIQQKKTEQDDLYAQVQQLKSEREKNTSGVRELIDKKKGIKEEVDGLIAERSAILDEKRAMQKGFNEWEKKERLLKQKKQDELWAQKRAEENAEWAKWELERPNPYLAETIALEQTIAYCKGLLPKEDVVAEETKVIDHNNPEGAKILVNKKDRDSEMYFSATKKKNLRKKGGLDKKAVAIKHNAETLQMFEKMKLSPPMTTLDLEPCLAKLQTEMDKVNDKVHAWEKERKGKQEVAAAATAATAATTETKAE